MDGRKMMVLSGFYKIDKSDDKNVYKAVATPFSLRHKDAGNGAGTTTCSMMCLKKQELAKNISATENRKERECILNDRVELQL